MLRSLTVAERQAFNPYATDLPASRFALHIRGDLPGSNRIYDIVRAGALPVVASKDVGVTLPFLDTVPWNDIMLRVPEGGDPKALRRALMDAISVDDADAARRLQLIRRHAADVLWEADGSRVLTNTLVFAARHCLGKDVPAGRDFALVPYRPKWRHRWGRDRG